MRVRTALILEESLLETIDEIAGEKKRRAAVIETALREFIAREGRKAQPKLPVKNDSAVASKR
jgi:metal-responsive CopG/Arc/MetJ family transcriptional regulator